MSTFAAMPSRSLSAEDVARMVETGVLGEDEPLELLDGVLVEMSPQGPVHSGILYILRRRLEAVYTDAVVRTQAPLLASRDSLPEPDIAVVSGKPHEYLARHPEGSDCLLVVEIAVTSQAVERAKATIYAGAGVPVHWMLDLAEGRLLVHTMPRDLGGHRLVEHLAAGDEVMLPGLEQSWKVADLLP